MIADCRACSSGQARSAQEIRPFNDSPLLEQDRPLIGFPFRGWWEWQWPVFWKGEFLPR